ncbi:MaoC family dehydratase [Saccharospirillum sp.]|uniref:MaoC family dehydratase n=1 Tax=Saccharospirillum sp. TaxID=2033801 RepID=UPI0034A03C1F
MITVGEPLDLKANVGKSLGSTEWQKITQTHIDTFAELTGDDHWIHVDIERAARELPQGKTIAHGLFLLSLIPRLQRQLFIIEKRGAGLNYGYEKVRFTAPVPVDSLVCLTQTILGVRPRGNGVQIEIQSTIELQDSLKPALVAHGILLIENLK